MSKGEGGLEKPHLDRLRWRCRRGLLELDLILGGFLDNGYRGLTARERLAFERLLSLPDHELLACVQGQKTPATELKDIVRKLRQ